MGERIKGYKQGKNRRLGIIIEVACHMPRRRKNQVVRFDHLKPSVASPNTVVAGTMPTYSIYKKIHGFVAIFRNKTLFLRHPNRFKRWGETNFS